MGELDTTQAWEAGKGIAEKIGTVPATFSSCIRFLRLDAEQNHNEIGKNSRACLLRLLKSKSFFSPLHHCAMSFRANAVSSAKPSAIIDAFSASELSMVIALLYLFRRVRRLSNPAEFDTQSKYVHVQADLGTLTGMAIQRVGFSTGLLTGAIRPLAVAMYLVADPKGFADYKRALKRQNLQFDFGLEEQFWGCNHVHVASILLQLLGLGKDLGDMLSLGLMRDNFASQDAASEHRAVQTAAIWIESLQKSGKAPATSQWAQYYPYEDALQTLLTQVDRLRSRDGGPSAWLARGKEDAATEPSEADPIIAAQQLSEAELKEIEGDA